MLILALFWRAVWDRIGSVRRADAHQIQQSVHAMIQHIRIYQGQRVTAGMIRRPEGGRGPAAERGGVHLAVERRKGAVDVVLQRPRGRSCVGAVAGQGLSKVARFP